MGLDSALGEQCGSVANFVKGTTDKVANLPQSLQSSHSPTAILRIFLHKKVDSRKNAPNLNTPQDSRISKETALRLFCDEKPLFASRVSEIRLERLSSSRGAAIKGLSRKAESTNPKANARKEKVW